MTRRADRGSLEPQGPPGGPQADALNHGVEHLILDLPELVEVNPHHGLEQGPLLSLGQEGPLPC